MYKNFIVFAFISCIFATFFCSCVTKKYLTLKSQLDNPLKVGRITVLTKDGSLYKLNNYLIKDSLLIGTGMRKEGYEQVAFSAELKLEDINFVGIYKRNYRRPL